MNILNRKSLILIIAVLGLSMVVINPILAQTPNYSKDIPTPTVPKFTVKFVQSEYTEIVTDPYTGAKTTEQVNNSTIELIIKNQPFSPYNYSWTYMNSPENGSTSLLYDVQAKGHYAQNWTDLSSANNVYPAQSNSSDYTILYIPQGSSTNQPTSVTLQGAPEYPAGGQVDFRVRAIIGGYFPPVLNSYVNYPLTYISKNSSWSTTQTITIPVSSTSTSTSPTPAPASTAAVPELSALAVIPLFVSVLVVFTIIRFRKRLQKKSLGRYTEVAKPIELKSVD